MLASLSDSNRKSFIMILMIAILYFCSGSMMLYLPKFFVSLQASKQTAGILVAFAVIPFVMFSMLSGYFANKFGAGRLVLLGTSLHFVAALLYLTVDEISTIIYLLRIMQGVGHVCVFTPLFTAVARIVPDDFKAQGIGYFTIAIQLGTASGSFLGELAIAEFGYSIFFITIAAMNVICAIASRFLHETSHEEKVNATGDGSSEGSTNWLLVSGGMVLILVLGGVFGTLLQFIPVYFDEMFTSGVIFEVIPSRCFLTSALITVACIRLFGGRHSDGKHKGVIVLACHIGLLIAVYLITKISGIGTSLAISILFGLSYGLLYPMINAYVLTQVSKGARGVVTGALTMLFEGGFRGYALVAGIVAHHFGFIYMFYTLLIFYALGAVIYYATILLANKNLRKELTEKEFAEIEEEEVLL